MTHTPDRLQPGNEKYGALIQASLLSLGWIVAKFGMDVEPAHWLAQALKGLEINSVCIDAVLARRRDLK